MNIEYVKIGETYYVPFTVKAISGEYVTATTGGTLEALFLAKTLHPIPSAPKYDPCRPFREGDEVRYVPCNGRECPAMPCDEYYREKTLTVVKDEDSNHQVLVRTQDGREKYIRFCYLQLITPVEELEPYIVKKYSSFYAVEKRNDLKDRPATYDVDFHPHAKEAAEAERDRLNAEHRKKQDND